MFTYTHKSAGSVNLYRFTYFPSGSIFANCLLRKHLQFSFNGICDTGYTIFNRFVRSKIFPFYLCNKKVMTAAAPNGRHPFSVQSLQSSLFSTFFPNSPAFFHCYILFIHKIKSYPSHQINRYRYFSVCNAPISITFQKINRLHFSIF